MQNKNKYYRRSRISEEDFIFLVRSYMLNINAKESSSPLSYTTKKGLYKQFRQYIYDNIYNPDVECSNRQFDGYCYGYQIKKNQFILFTLQKKGEQLTVCTIKNFSLIRQAKNEIFASMVRNMDIHRLRSLYIRYTLDLNKKEVYALDETELRKKIITSKNKIIKNKIIKFMQEKWNYDRLQKISGYDIYIFEKYKNKYSTYHNFFAGVAFALHPYSGLECTDIDLYLAECNFKHNCPIEERVEVFLEYLKNKPLNS